MPAAKKRAPKKATAKSTVAPKPDDSNNEPSVQSAQADEEAAATVHDPRKPSKARPYHEAKRKR